MGHNTKFDMEASEKEALATKIDAVVKLAEENGVSGSEITELKAEAKTLHDAAKKLAASVNDTENVDVKH